MRVKFLSNSPLSRGLVLGSCITVIILLIFFSATSFRKDVELNADTKEVNLLLRNLGHRLLLQAGDQTSRVLPVTDNKEGSFFLRFESEFTFNHDSLITLSQKLLPKTQFPSGYTVAVHDCEKNDIVYGFQLDNKTADLLACTGRNQPKGCYSIEFSFRDFNKTPGLIQTGVIESGPQFFRSPLMFATYGAILAVCTIFLVNRFSRSPKKFVKTTEETPIAESTSGPGLPMVGKFAFDVKGQRLLFSGDVIDLTDKECRVLEMLHENFGELITRETLMQKIWIDEGVITGRSLDVFISKLRKKLSPDPTLKITNVHGKGYKLGTI